MTDQQPAKVMTKAEREELAKLVRRREKLAKADIDVVAAGRLADFEQQMASIYQPEDDPVWARVRAEADAAVAAADAEVAERCRALGIPAEFRPTIGAHWYGRGENAAAKRRAELRAVVKARTDADGKAAKAAIERRSVDIQTELVAGVLESDEARQFLASMPTAEALMPRVPSVPEIEATLNGRHSAS